MAAAKNGAGCEVKIADNRNYGLDILRAVAIIAVVHGHGYALVANYIKAAPYGLYLDLDGVSLFFVLSGFLIGGILIKAITSPNFGARELLNFWTRRWFRTLPNYYLVLGGYLVFFYFKNGAWVTISHLLLTFTQSVFGAPPYFFSEAWSLAVEEWFYLLVPALLLICIRLLRMKPQHALLLCMAVVIFACTAYRIDRAIAFDYFTKIDPSAWGYNMAQPVACRLDAIMYGVIGAYVARYRSDIYKGRENKLFAAGVVMLALGAHAFALGQLDYSAAAFYQNTLYFPVLSIGALMLLPKLLTIKCWRRCKTDPLRRSKSDPPG